MDSSLEVLVVLAAAIAAVATVWFVVYRKVARGMWAAGYWWSDRDRARGPGC
jgi:hypothetical protein